MTDLQLLCEIKKAKNKYWNVMELDMLEDDVLNHIPISKYLDNILGLGFRCIEGDDTKIISTNAGHYPYVFLLRSDIELLIQLLNDTLEYYDELAITDDVIKYTRFKDIIRQHEEYLEQKGKNKDEKITVDDLYLIRDTVDNALKIGRSKNPKSRLSQLQLSTSHNLELLQSVKGKGYMEKELHNHFSSIRLASEWFKDDGTIIKYFKENLL